MKIESVQFVCSAAGAADLPDAGLPEFSMVGRSNVGKSTLINALVKRPVARTSGTPGKTRLINLYRVATRQTGPFFLVDLPGYGYAKKEARQEFDRLASLYFARAMPVGRGGPPWPPTAVDVGDTSGRPQGAAPTASRVPPIGVLLALDARHPGMDSDVATLRWLRERGFAPVEAGDAPLLVVVTKIDKVSRNERARTLARFEELSGQPVAAVSAVTGEGMEDLWKQMTSWVAWAARNRQRSRP